MQYMQLETESGGMNRRGGRRRKAAGLWLVVGATDRFWSLQSHTRFL